MTTPTQPARGVRRGIVVLLLLGTAASPLPAQQLPADSAIHAIVRDRVESGRAAGIVVGVLEKGERRFFVHGSAGAGRDQLSEHTYFEIGSIAKTFTSLLLADAVKRGEVSLDQPVAELLPAGTRVPAHAAGPITLQHLATHRSGLPRLPTNLAPANPGDPYADYDEARLYAFLAGHSPTRAPGEGVEYSNLGVGLLGHALALRAGVSSWGELVDQRITGPLGMTETVLRASPAEIRRWSAGHDAALDTVPAWNLDVLAGAGALRSTASDMLTYLAAQLEPGGTPLADAITLTHQPRGAYDQRNRIGLGWVISGSEDDPVIWHNGGTGGFRAFAAFRPSRDVAVVVLANAALSADDIGMHLLNPAIPLAPPAVVQRTQTVSLTTEQLDRVVGDYRLAPTFVLQVTREGDAVFVEATGQQKLRLWPSAPDRFVIREVGAELHFTLPESGPATGVTLLQGGNAQTAPRSR